MYRPDWILRVLLLPIALCLAIIAASRYVHPEQTTLAAGRFDHVNVVSPTFLYKGSQGVLLLDLRNGNIWFTAKGDKMDLTFRDPVFVGRLPLEKLDQAPQ